ncbi:GCS-domain-containing protein [Basidiobolus meristosporus CBS 931.73]|uniref:Glutamate--cysteine ligase n=1 Tax=Basidiobolus meristosporus CBS 931.73 TaxID=1314790 RepID=A0A1Y1YZU8_9FUNG|nr:GCS-domain-containing protein [Basidiobolus meristosporus CBS 931.73]|eukprot:ORY03394.1 GCS-domain-containing protein [Basidiobolus meristosporus CBS 931.73]
MGLLSLGTPMQWDEAKKYADHVRSHGIKQFLSIYHKLKDRKKDHLLWGDEIEYMVVDYDHENKNARLSLRAFDLINELQKSEIEAATNPDIVVETSWRPEYGRYMLEGTPGAPYGGTLDDLLLVEKNMVLRRNTVMQYMKENEYPLTVTSFPRLGCPGEFLTPYYEPKGVAARSMFVPDEIINPHARFPTLTANIRKRRQAKVAINMPIFHDTNTPKPFIDPTIPHDRDVFPEDKEAGEGAALPDHIYMDAMCFGMGCCCLQITFQACNIDEARRLYDHLATVGPIMLALTAAAPVYRGYLADVDCRWNVIAQSVDDRTREERGLEPLKNSKFAIPKSRYDSIDSYLSTDSMYKPEYNDIPLVLDEQICQELMDNGVDEQLARHVAHLFIRDPLVIFEELLDQDDEVSSDHFENLQSTNWQTMRFKPPPPNSPIGWRVEFRSMEIQLTDFENAAFAIFIVLLTRAILSFGLNFYIPISKVDENMKTAHKRGAAREHKFYFRKHVFQDDSQNEASTNVENEYELMTINEIINGKDDGFPGLIPIVNSYLNSLNVDIETRRTLGRYLDFIKCRADGTLMTTATWIRQFVRTHPSYKHDSHVSQEINYDLMRTIEKVNKGELKIPELFGDFI